MRLPAACVALCLLVPIGRAGAAETCPEVPAEDASSRRAMAKDWFARAEEAEAAGDRQAAVRRYSCSLKLVPHPSTAYNLGTAAEKSGDLSMAVDAFKVYVDLAPDAADRASVQTRIARLEARLVELRQQIQTKPAEPDPQTAVPGKPDPAGRPPGPIAPPIATPPTTPRPASTGHKTAGLVALAGAVGALGGGVAFNLMARAKMSDCRANIEVNPTLALGQCDTAKTFAYSSYGLFGLAGALGITSLTLLLWKAEDGTAVSLVPGADGALLFATRRF